MKKFITSAIAAIILAGMVPVQAADMAVVCIYRDGKLVYSTNTTEKQDGVYRFRISDEYENDELTVYSTDKAEYTVEFSTVEEQPAPTSSASPEPTAEPTDAPKEEATAAPTRTPYPAVYEKALDAVNAPAVVRSVSEKTVDGEIWYETTMLYQGVEITADIYEGALIESAPSIHSELIGENVSALKEGDIIHFTCDLQHRVKSVEFILRPDMNEITDNWGNIVGGDNYSSFYFGVPVKTAKGYMLLADKNGKTTEIDLHSGTFVYTVTPRSRGEKTELSGTGYSQIPVSYAGKDNLDSNDNVINMEEVDPVVYVLARVRNGCATEVIVFEN